MIPACDDMHEARPLTEVMDIDTEHLVDPELASLLDVLPTLALSDETLPVVRGWLGQMLPAQSAVLGRVETVEKDVPGPASAPDVRVVISRPANQATTDVPVVLWIHGGGYVLGCAEQNQPFADTLVTELGCVVVAVDHRLAPETPHPGPVEDCYAALQWIHSESRSLGVDPNRVVVAGESAGGGLAAAVCLLARDRGDPAVCLTALVYPMLDDRTTREQDPNPYTGQYVWTRPDNDFGWTALLGQPPGGADISSYAAPARADSLVGLPPTFISVGALDLFLDENIEYAHRLLRAGVPTDLHVYAGAFHGFLSFDGSDLSRRHHDDLFGAMRRAFRTTRA
jgi:acetyl esterase/lipase